MCTGFQNACRAHLTLHDVIGIYDNKYAKSTIEIMLGSCIGTVDA